MKIEIDPEDMVTETAITMATKAMETVATTTTQETTTEITKEEGKMIETSLKSIKRSPRKVIEMVKMENSMIKEMTNPEKAEMMKESKKEKSFLLMMMKWVN